MPRGVDRATRPTTLDTTRRQMLDTPLPIFHDALRARATNRPVSLRATATDAMNRYAQGDESAYGTLYCSIAPSLHAYLLRRTRNRSRAEDLLQQTMLQIHLVRARFLTGSDVFPWAFAIARRVWITSSRRRREEL